VARLLVADVRARSPAWALTAAAEARLRTSVPDGWDLHLVSAETSFDGEVNPSPSREVVEAIGGAEAYFGFGMSAPLLAAAGRLRWIQSAGAGVGSLLALGLDERGIVLTNAAGIHAQPMADTVLGGVMYFLRGLDVAAAQQKDGRWVREPWVDPAPWMADVQAREIADCRVLVVGTGGIGQAVARRFSALGARLAGVRRRPELGTPTGFEEVVGDDELDEMLGWADVVVLAAPATERTSHLLDAPRLRLLRRGAIVVNVARGALVDEAALVEALSEGRLRGAVLDVFSQEPLPADSPLWRLPNVLVTPHVSAVSPARFWDRMLALFLENWERYRRGERLLNQVDASAGY
jgi:phosphoglycerate dehydrogenase-like enzyme